jgi:hypothetical protein
MGHPVLFCVFCERSQGLSRLFGLHRAAVESKVFSLDKPLSLYKSFSGNASDQSAYFDKLALQLATVMSTIADNPYVCYTTNNPRNEVRAIIWPVYCTYIYYLGGGGVLTRGLILCY